MERCGNQVIRFHHKRITCGANIFIPASCDVRACRHCGKARTAREVARYSDGIAGFHRPALLTLTVPNVETVDELCKALETLTKGFERLRRHKEWPKAARGVWSLEITWSEDKGYHPHIHAVCDFPWVNFEWLNAAWEELTGAKHRPDVTRPRSQEERDRLPWEGMKYVTKAWELPPDVLRTLLAVLGRRRLFNSFGGLRAKKDDSESSGACCPGCEAPLAYCFRNLDRSTLQASEVDGLVTWLRIEGRPVYTDWFYPDREPDPDIPIF